MHTPTTTGRRAPLAIALFVALLAPGLAFAQSAKEQEPQRIAQLEAQVQALIGAQQQQQASIVDTKTQLDQVKVAQAAPADGKPHIQSTPILTAGNPDSRFSYGGFIKVDAMVIDTNAGEIADGSAGRMFYLPGAILVGGADERTVDTDTHAQFSRFWFASDGEMQGHKTRAYLEFDLFGGGSNQLGNEAATNTHALTLRQAYVTWDKWLAGQAWSNFQTVALPDAVDFVGPTEGTTFVRQAQLRYTSGAFSVALENPQTVLTNYCATTRINSDDSVLPDITARWTKKGTWGHVSVAGLARQLRHETATTSASGSGFGTACPASTTSARTTTSATCSPAARHRSPRASRLAPMACSMPPRPTSTAPACWPASWPGAMCSTLVAWQPDVPRAHSSTTTPTGPAWHLLAHRSMPTSSTYFIEFPASAP